MVHMLAAKPVRGRHATRHATAQTPNSCAKSRDAGFLGLTLYPEAPRTQYLAPRVWGDNRYSTGFGLIHDYWVLGTSGLPAF